MGVNGKITTIYFMVFVLRYVIMTTVSGGPQVGLLFTKKHAGIYDRPSKSVMLYSPTLAIRVSI